MVQGRTLVIIQAGEGTPLIANYINIVERGIDGTD
jgi:hypothetical protein